MRLNLDIKINIIVFIVVCSLGATLGTYFVKKETALLKNELNLRNNFTGRLLALSIEDALESKDLDALDESLQAAVLGEENAYVIVKSLDGEIKAAHWKRNTSSNVEEQNFPLHADSNLANVQPGELFGAVDHASHREQIGTLAIGTDLSPLYAKRKALIIKTGTLVLSASLAAMLLGFFSVRLLLRSAISPLLAGIREIGAGNLSYRINSKQNNEIGDIGSAIDGMANELATSLVTRQELESTIQIRTKELQESLAEKVQVEIVLRNFAEDLEQRIKERTVELEMANKELDAFVYSVSHDLRAPLRRIDSFSSVLQNDYGHKLDEEAKNYLERIRKGCEHMTHLIDDLLTLSQLARAEINRIPLNLSNMVLQIAEEMQKLEPERQVEFKIPPGITAHADPVLISSVMENLVGNAWKFTRRTEKPVIEFGTTLEDGSTTYFVRDNGAGFDPEYADKLFIAFQRLHRSDEFEGTGIGLVSVQRVIHRHGGSIRAEGRVGEGATFYFTLQARG